MTFYAQPGRKTIQTSTLLDALVAESKFAIEQRQKAQARAERGLASRWAGSLAMIEHLAYAFGLADEYGEQRKRLEQEAGTTNE